MFECLSWLLFRAVLLCQFMALRFETCVRCGGAQRLAVLTGTSACLVTKRCGTMVALVAATVPILAAKLRGALSRACPRIERADTDKLAYTLLRSLLTNFPKHVSE